MKKIISKQILIIVHLLIIFCYLTNANKTNENIYNATIKEVQQNEIKNQQQQQQQKSIISYQQISNNTKKKLFKTTVLNDEQFKFLQDNLKFVKNVNCRNDLSITLLGIRQGLPWAIQMYDSSVKIPFGIESGSVYQFGNFDECLNINNYENVDRNSNNDYNRNHYNRRIMPKYCLADVIVNGLQVRSIASRTYEPKNQSLVHWGICIPISCGTQDVESIMSNILGYEVHVDENKCTIQKDFEVTKGMTIYACVVLCFVMMTLFCTLYHFYYMIFRNDIIKHNLNNNFLMVVKSFSIVENMKKLFQQSNDALGLNAINGVKAVSMIFIVLGHSLLFVVGGPVLNSDFFATDIKRVQNAFLINSPLFVDTFLLLSGFLFCRILIKELEKRHGKVNFAILYVFRYIRLTPAYLAVIAFYMTWFKNIGNGPLWNSRIGIERERCENSWWLNLLYINNYFGTENLCMFQSWYLSVDTQLFILAPIIIYFLWRARKWGITLLGISTFVTTLIPICLTYFKDLDPTLFVYADEVTDISANPYFTQIYMKTHMRAVAYVCGLIVGFILHVIQEKSIKFSKSFVTIIWIFSSVIGILSMFSVMVFINTNYTTLEGALYAGFHRLGWSIFTGWIIIACTTGHGGILKSILASRVFAPISRLTYCAYLTNGIVELYELGTLREPVYMSHVNLTGLAFTHTIFTFAFALVLCLLFESPIHGIEKILLRKDNQRRQMEERKSKDTPSTSEETA